ncbi:MAG: sugar phosphate isomerase/epimerase [Chloroflexi bacterium]|nr:sugar phosphate isomerase/epimerase [Chloroflexota bacterium]
MIFRTSMAISPAPAKFAPLLFAGEWELALQTACELGYDAVEVSLRDPKGPVVPRLGEAITKSGLSLSAVATGQSYYTDGLCLASTDPTVQKQLMDRLKGLVDFAAAWQAIIILGGVRGMLSGPLEAQLAQKEAAFQMMDKLAAYALPAGVRLALEPINRYETNFLNTVQECLDVIDRLGYKNLIVLPDTFHMNIEEASLPAAFRAAGSRLGYLHFPDSNRQAPGRGHINFFELVEVLQEMAYSGYICAEILPLPNSRQAAEWAMQTFRLLRSHRKV